jgi:hypothetical protein
MPRRYVWDSEHRMFCVYMLPEPPPKPKPVYVPESEVPPHERLCYADFPACATCREDVSGQTVYGVHTNKPHRFIPRSAVYMDPSWEYCYPYYVGVCVDCAEYICNHGGKYRGYYTDASCPDGMEERHIYMTMAEAFDMDADAIESNLCG